MLVLTLIAPFFIALAINFNKPKWILRTLIQYFHLSKIDWFKKLYLKKGEEDEDEDELKDGLLV